MPFPIRLSWLGGLAAALALSVAAQAAPAVLTADDQALVDQAAAYLQGLTEMKGRFEQTDARGGVTHGDLYLDRPGRARFAYDPPSSLLVVSDGHTVSVADPRLKTVNHYPLSATPLSLFLARDVRFDHGITVTRIDSFSDGYAITVRDAHRSGRGEITLTFATTPLHLAEWSMIDGQGRTTRVKLIGLQQAPGLDPGLFVGPDRREAAQPAP